MVLITTCGASSTIMGAICRVKSPGRELALGVAPGPIDIGCCGGLVPCANAGGSMSGPVAITVAHPNRTKSLRFMRSLYRLSARAVPGPALFRRGALGVSYGVPTGFRQRGA